MSQIYSPVSDPDPDSDNQPVVLHLDTKYLFLSNYEQFRWRGVVLLNYRILIDPVLTNSDG